MDLFRNIAMGLGLVQLISWGLGIIMMGLMLGWMSSTDGLFGNGTIGEMRAEFAKAEEERRTDAWYRAGASGQTPYYAKDGRSRPREMGDPMVELKRDDPYRRHY